MKRMTPKLFRHMKTIDEFVDYYMQQLRPDLYDCSIIHYIVQQHSLEILIILDSEHNKPSKWDLMIIDNINKINKDKLNNYSYMDILKAYKNRNQ